MIYRLSMPVVVAVVSAGLFLAPLGVNPAMAQSGADQSVKEMTENFKKQKTRGLVIVAPDANASFATEGTQARTDMDQMATAVPKEEQVNVNISFDFDSATLREDQKPKLVSLCAALTAANVQKVRILGHTDASGPEEYNQRLSKLRAEEVKRYLAADCGFPVDRMDAQGVGERFLFDPANPRAEINRRVEFQALG